MPTTSPLFLLSSFFSTSLRRTHMHLYEYLRFWTEMKRLEVRFETYGRKRTQSNTFKTMKYFYDRTRTFEIPKERKLFKNIDEFEMFLMSNMGSQARYLLNRNTTTDHSVIFSDHQRSTPFLVKFRYVAKTKLPKRVLSFFNMRVRMAQQQDMDFCRIYRFQNNQCRIVSMKAALNGALDMTEKKQCYLMARQRNQRAVFQLI